jgi:RNA polymerase sigma-70 factor (ECF subfamily)
LSPEERLERSIASKVDRALVIEMIMDEYGTVLKRLIYTYVKDWNIASDLTQETFITVYEKLESFQYRSSFKTWIFTIAINKSKDYLKSWHYRNMVMNEKVFFLKKNKEKDPETKFLERDQQDELLKVIESLSVKYREVFLLHYYQDLSLAEVSETLDVPISTVKTRLYRGQEKVKKLYSSIERGEQHG